MDTLGLVKKYNIIFEDADSRLSSSYDTAVVPIHEIGRVSFESYGHGQDGAEGAPGKWPDTKRMNWIKQQALRIKERSDECRKIRSNEADWRFKLEPLVFEQLSRRPDW